LLSSSPKIRDHKENLVIVDGDVLRAFGKMKIALGEEGVEFRRIGTVKGIRVPEIRFGRTRSCSVSIPSVDGVLKGGEGLNEKTLVRIWTSWPTR
jgi:hypothetical protein